MKKLTEKERTARQLKDYILFQTRLVLAIGQHGHARIDVITQKDLRS